MNVSYGVGAKRILGACLGLLSSRFKILAYHSIATHSRDPFEVSADMFKRQMQILVEEGYNVISLEQGWNDLRAGRICKDTVVITFDDGFKSLQDYAFPILEQNQFPATVFVPFDYVGRIDSFSYEQPRPDFELLSQKEIESSMGKGISYGSHTMSHTDLTQLSGKKLMYELKESKRYLNEILGIKFSSLAYPFGMFDERVKHAAIDSGYDCALCFGNVLSNSRYTQLIEMKREKILDSATLDEFKNCLNVRNDVCRKLAHYIK